MKWGTKIYLGKYYNSCNVLYYSSKITDQFFSTNWPIMLWGYLFTSSLYDQQNYILFYFSCGIHDISQKKYINCNIWHSYQLFVISAHLDKQVWLPVISVITTYFMIYLTDNACSSTIYIFKYIQLQDFQHYINYICIISDNVD